jgi:hypothetical protein
MKQLRLALYTLKDVAAPHTTGDRMEHVAD